jgi:hypothetical protein
MVRRAAFTAVIAFLVTWATDVPSSQRAPAAELRILIAPDHLFEEIRAAIDGATTSIDLRVHTLDNADLVDAMVSRQLSGVRVRVVLDRGPTSPISDQERWAAQQIEQAGGAVFVRQPSTTAAYPLEHARFIIVDDTRVLVGSEDLTYAGMPADRKSDGTAGHRGIYVLLTNRAIADHLKAIFSETLKPTASYTAMRWNFSHPAHGAPARSFQPARTSGGNGYQVVRNTSLRLEGSVPVGLVGCPARCVSEPDALLMLVSRAGPGDTVLVQLYEAGDANPRMEAFLAAARRGADVRILLDRADDDPADPRGNRGTALRIDTDASRAVLKVRLPTHKGAIHNGTVLANLRGTRCSWAVSGSRTLTIRAASASSCKAMTRTSFWKKSSRTIGRRTRDPLTRRRRTMAHTAPPLHHP